MKLEISSTAFVEGQAIPIQYTCDGENISPSLRWGSIPKQTQSLALVCEDPDAPSGTFVHWIIFNLPPLVSDLPEALPAEASLVENQARQGRNDFGRFGYSGPCPPPGEQHHYIFRLYALDIELPPEAGATKDEFRRALADHVLAEGHLTCIYQRKQRATATR